MCSGLLKVITCDKWSVVVFVVVVGGGAFFSDERIIRRYVFSFGSENVGSFPSSY